MLFKDKNQTLKSEKLSGYILMRAFFISNMCLCLYRKSLQREHILEDKKFTLQWFRGHSDVTLYFYLHLQLLTIEFFSPTSGGKQMTKLSTHSAAIKSLARECDIILGYVIGRVTATYRSREIAHRFKIDAVHIQTSSASHILHQTCPNIHTWNKITTNAWKTT